MRCTGRAATVNFFVAPPLPKYAFGMPNAAAAKNFGSTPA